MAEKTLKTRIQLKNETAENWGKATNFIPKQGEMIVYNYDVPRLKIGDGSTKVNSLSFLDENFVFKTTTINSKPLSSNITLTKTDLGLGNVGNFKAVSTVASQGLTSSEKSAARANIGAGTSSFSGNYNDLTNKPTIPNYSVATSSSNGLMSSSDKSKLDGIAAGANKYTHPTYTAKSSGLYKVTVDSTGHVSAATAVKKSDITALGIPSSDTTYTVMTGATSSSAGASGLVPAPASGKNTSFLRGDGTWVVPTNTTYSQATSSTLGLVKIGYTENGKNYPVELSNGQMFVNVPWQNTTYTLSSFGITATASELNYCDGVTSNIQAQLNNKAPLNHTHTDFTGVTDFVTIKVSRTIDNVVYSSTYGVNSTSGNAYISYSIDGEEKNYISFRDISTSLKQPLTIASGGTGAATADEACENIGAVKKSGDTMTSSLSFKYDSITDSTCGIGMITDSSSDESYASFRLMTDEFVTGQYSHLKLFKDYWNVTKDYLGYFTIRPPFTNASSTTGIRFSNHRGQVCAGVFGPGGGQTEQDSSRIWFRIYSNDGTDSLEKYEEYYLPEVAQNMTSNKSYVVLTSKNEVTVAQGGTGATTAAQALINLGLTATATELNYCNGVTSNIQTQLDEKAPSSHSHDNYLCSYVTDRIPANSDLNDYYNRGTYAVDSATVSASLSNCPITNAGFMLYTISPYTSEPTGAKNVTQILISGSANGKVYIRRGNGTTWNQWYCIPFDTTATTSSNGLMSKTDKSKLDGIATSATRNPWTYAATESGSIYNNNPKEFTVNSDIEYIFFSREFSASEAGVWYVQFWVEGPPAVAGVAMQASINLVTPEGTRKIYASHCAPSITGLYQTTLCAVIPVAEGDSIDARFIQRTGASFTGNFRKQLYRIK